MAKKKGTVTKVGEGIKDAAAAVAKAADEYVVQPVGKAVGLIPAAEAPPPKPARKAPRKKAAAPKAGPKATATRGTKSTKSTAGKAPRRK